MKNVKNVGKSKNYDPFKMFGSYIGLVVGLILSYALFASLAVLCSFSACKSYTYYLLLIPIIIGFLLGWGIHSIFRKLKKR